MKLFNIEIGRRKIQDEYLGARGNFVSRWARPPSRNTTEWLEMFAKSPRLAVVDRIASDLASVKGHLLRVDKDGNEMEITNHRFLNFMAQPNPLYEMTSSAIWRLHEIYLLLVGESFFLIERDAHDRPVELWNVPPHWVKLTPYLGNPTYQIISPGGLSMTVPVDDMFVMKHLNPADPFTRGLGVAESIADEVEIDEYAAKFQKRFFYNDATPPIVFAMPTASEEQREAFMARWNKRHRGVENSHRAAAITGDINIHELGKGEGKNLGFIESREAMRDAVLEHFGVPREIMGITENSNRATADSAQYIYAKNVLTPRLRNREEAINKQLLPLFGDNLIWRFDAVIPYDKEFDKSVALDGWNSGLLTKNEARSLLDKPAVDGGDVFRTTNEELFIRETDDPVEFAQRRIESEKVEPTDQKSIKAAEKPFDVNSMLRKEELSFQSNERLFETAITRHFSEQNNRIALKLNLNSKANDPLLFDSLSQYVLPDGTFNSELWAQLSDEIKEKITEAIAMKMLDWNEEIKNLLLEFTPLWQKTYDDGTRISQESYKLLTVERPEFVSAAKINGGKRIIGIEETTRKSIASIISNCVENGVSQRTLLETIHSELPKATRSRVKLIAQQETSTALATGQFDMMKAAGATTKTWHHRPQRNPRDGTHGKVNHVILEGETVDIDKPFSNGLLYPRDPKCNKAEEVVRCRCYLTYSGWGERNAASSTVDEPLVNQFQTQSNKYASN